jgi:DNA repair protein RadC
MENNKQTGWILESEMFGEGKRHYFIDMKKARNNSNYLRISRTDKVAENKFQRSGLVIFEQDMRFFVEALTMVLGRWSDQERKNTQQLELWN